MTCPTHVHKMPATNMQAQRPQGQAFNKALNNAAGGAQFAPQAANFGNAQAFQPRTNVAQNPIAQIARELSNVAGQLEGLMNAGFVGIQGGMGSMFSLKGLSQGLRQVSNMLFQMSGSMGGGGQFAQVLNLGGGGAMQPAYGQFGGQNNGLQLRINLPMNGGGFANGGNFGGMNFNGAGTAQYGFGNTQPALFLRAPANQNGFAAQQFQGGNRPTFAAPQGGQHNHGAHNHGAHNHGAHNHAGHQARPMPAANRPAGHANHAGHNHNAHAGHNHGANNAHAGHNHNAQAGNNAHAGHNHAGHNHAQQGGVGAGHDFYSHARHLFPNALAPTQRQYGGFHVTGDKQITGRSTITGLQPVIEQAVAQVKAANPNLTGADLEAKIANKLTNLNDWENLTPQTQEALVRATGQDFGKMTKAEREKSINHLLHSPLPFGDINQPLTKDWSIDLGYTHTLDKAKTTAEDLGNGFFRIKLISNNNNGSHTGHNMGSFVVKLDAGTTEAEAKKIGNGMVTNTNNNNKLYLDEAARNYLHNH